jgi:hypothetical protein
MFANFLHRKIPCLIRKVAKGTAMHIKNTDPKQKIQKNYWCIIGYLNRDLRS